MKFKSMVKSIFGKKRFGSSLSILLFVALILQMVTFTAFATEEGVESWDDLVAAVQAAPEDGSKTTIKVAGDIELEGTISIPSGSDILIESSGGDVSTLSTTVENRRHFSIGSGGKLTLKNITLDGGWDGITKEGLKRSIGGVSVSDGELVLEYGATIKNCSYNNGGGVMVISNKAQLRMEDGSLITTCLASLGGSYGGGVRLDSGGTFIMNGGGITNCDISAGSAGAAGGAGVAIVGGPDATSTFIMNGGKIYDNVVIDDQRNYGAGVLVTNYGRFEMNDGEISGNKLIQATNAGALNGIGGGVAVVTVSALTSAGHTKIDPHHFVMKGGKISGNDAALGGGVSVWRENGSFTMNGGEISGNRASYGGGVHIDEAGKFDLEELDGVAAIINDNSAYMGGGVSLYAFQDDIMGYTDGKDPVFTMKSGTISNNKATSREQEFGGGGLYAYLVYPETDIVPVNITGGSFLNNTASFGGGIYIRARDYDQDAVLANISKIELTENKSPLTGSGLSYGAGMHVYADQGVINLSDSSITKNTADKSGGGMAIFNGVQANVSGTTFDQNTAKEDGGGIYYNKQTSNNSSTLNVTGASVSTNNVAGRNGGGICTMRDDGSGALERNLESVKVAADVKFSNNSAANGYVWTLGDAGHQTDTATHETNILTKEYTEPFTNAYSNYDINYDAGTLLKKYTLEVVAEEGGTVDETVNGEYPEGHLVEISATPESGYKFTGWTSNAGGIFTDSKSANTTFEMPAADVVLTAKFAKEEIVVPGDPEYTVTYKANGGEGEHVVRHKNGTTHVVCTLAQTSITRTGYSFIGWNTAADGSGTSYARGKSFVVNSNVTLYAQWIVNEVDDRIDTENHFAYIIGYPNGTVGPEKNITRAEVASIFFRLLKNDYRIEVWTTTNSYTDVGSSKWFNNAISTLSNAGILDGYSDGTFRPNASVTRAELATIASRFAGDVPNDGSTIFSDISGHWAQKDIEKAAILGYVEGYSDGSFKPDSPITRAEVMTLINNVTNRHVGKDDMLENMVAWPDNDSSAWYYSAVQEATNSHYYDRKTDGVYEIWTQLRESPDWDILEGINADPESITSFFQKNN